MGHRRQTSGRETGSATIDDAIREIRRGKTIIVVDDDDRENEGDFVCAAEFVDAGGHQLLCDARARDHLRSADGGPCEGARARPDGRQQHVPPRDAVHRLRRLHHGTTTGVSAGDRAATVRALAAPGDEARATWPVPATSSRSGRWTAGSCGAPATPRRSSISASSRASRRWAHSARS